MIDPDRWNWFVDPMRLDRPRGRRHPLPSVHVANRRTPAGRHVERAGTGWGRYRKKGLRALKRRSGSGCGTSSTADREVPEMDRDSTRRWRGVEGAQVREFADLAEHGQGDGDERWNLTGWGGGENAFAGFGPFGRAPIRAGTVARAGDRLVGRSGFGSTIGHAATGHGGRAHGASRTGEDGRHEGGEHEEQGCQGHLPPSRLPLSFPDVHHRPNLLGRNGQVNRSRENTPGNHPFRVSGPSWRVRRNGRSSRRKAGS